MEEVRNIRTGRRRRILDRGWGGKWEEKRGRGREWQNGERRGREWQNGERGIVRSGRGEVRGRRPGEDIQNEMH